MAINPSTLYPDNTANPSVNYPYGSARDVSIPGDDTGTPWAANVLNDIWGFNQALLDRANITPSGNPDSVSASDYMTALSNIFNVKINNVAELIALENVSLGDKIQTLGYTTPGDGGGNLYEAVAAGTGTDDGGSFINCAGTLTIQWKALFGGYINVKHWGALGDGVADDTTPIQSGVNYVNSQGRGVLNFISGTYNHTGLVQKPGVIWNGENRETTIINYTLSTGDGISGGPDLNRCGFISLKFDSSSRSDGWAILFDQATVRNLGVFNCSIDRFKKGMKVSDGLQCVIDLLFISRPSLVAGSINLQLGNNAGQRGTTWSVNSLYATVAEDSIICWATASRFDTIIVENSTRCITTYSSGIWSNVYSENNVDFWFINDNGINIKGFREGATSGSDFTFSDAETERRTTVTPSTADTNPANPGKNYTYKFGTVYYYSNGKELHTSDGASEFLGNFPTQAGMRGNIHVWSDGTAEQELKIMVPDKIDAGIGKNFYLQAGGAKSGETNTDGGSLILQGAKVTGNGRSDVRISVAGGNPSGSTDYEPTESWVFGTARDLRPIGNGTQDIGRAGNQVQDIYLVNAPIVSSDRNFKDQILELDDAEIKTGLQILKTGYRKYKLKDSVERKGDKARIHVGVIAQEVMQAFIDNGLNPRNYALFCETEWATDQENYIETEKTIITETVEKTIDGKPVLHPDGTPVMTQVEKPVYTEVEKTREIVYSYADKPYPESATVHTKMGIRYDELDCFVFAAIGAKLGTQL